MQDVIMPLLLLLAVGPATTTGSGDATFTAAASHLQQTSDSAAVVTGIVYSESDVSSLPNVPLRAVVLALPEGDWEAFERTLAPPATSPLGRIMSTAGAPDVRRYAVARDVTNETGVYGIVEVLRIRKMDFSVREKAKVFRVLEVPVLVECDIFHMRGDRVPLDQAPACVCD